MRCSVAFLGSINHENSTILARQIWGMRSAGLCVLQAEGVRSKRFMKEMLLQMKKARHIKAIKGQGDSHFGYIMRDKLPPPRALPPQVQLKPVKPRFVQPAAQQHARQ